MQSAIIARVLPPPPRPPPPLMLRLAWLWCLASAIPVLVLVNAAGLGLAIFAIACLLAKMVAAWCVMVRWRKRDAKWLTSRSEVEFTFCADASGLDLLLQQHYRTPSAAKALLALGNLHVLGPELTQGTVAFCRDRDEPWSHNAPRVYGTAAFWSCPPLAGQARLWYLYDGTRWHEKDGRDALDSWDARGRPWREI